MRQLRELFGCAARTTVKAFNMFCKYKKFSHEWFLGVVGYHVCLTRRRSPVQVWQKSFFSFFILFGKVVRLAFFFFWYRSSCHFTLNYVALRVR